MSFFQKKSNYRNNCKFKNKAQSLQSIPYNYNPPPFKDYEKKAFLIAPVSLKGSIALESSFALPLFFMFFIQIISVITFIGFQSKLESSMYQCAKEMASYGYAYQKANLPIPDGILSAVYVQGRIQREVEDTKNKISLLNSRIMQKDMVDLVAYYKVKPIINILPFKEIPAYARCRVRAWTGFDNTNGLGETVQKDIYVFVTETGRVYHESRNCKFLDLSIKAVSGINMEKIRNQSGAKYYPCESCSKGSDEKIVYITEYGTRYHCYLGCRKLKRTVEAILLSETEGKPACQKCRRI